MEGNDVSYNEPPNYGSPPPPPGGPGGPGGYGSGGPGGYGNYGAPGPGGYGSQPQQTSVMAIISLVTGILGILCCGSFVLSIAAAILGFLGKKEIDEGRKTGRGLAMAGLILGIVGVVLSIAWWILVVATGEFNVYSDI